MKIIVTKEELLEFCSRCTNNDENGNCAECILAPECNGAYIDFWRDNTEIKE